MQLSTIRDNVYYNIEDKTDGSGRFPNSNINDFINEGQRVFATLITSEAIPALKEIATADTVDGQQSYALPSDFVRYINLEWKSNGVKYISCIKLPITERDALTENTLYTPSTTQPYVIVTNDGLYLFPTPSSSDSNVGSAYLQLDYIRQPATLSNDTDEPEIDLQYHHFLIDYATARAFQIMGQAERAKILYDKFYENIKAINLKFSVAETGK